jgi:thymidylate synthase
LEERDLGPIYGFQWRHFNAPYTNYDTDYTGQGIDQLKNVIETLKTNPRDRRMIVMAWNPTQVKEMGLPPCHYGFQLTTINGKLNLLWNQRSVDTMLGLPFNIASYALLLHLIAKETGLQEGKLVGFLADVHLFENHVEGAKEQLSRDPNKYPLPRVDTENWKSIFNWTAADTKVIGYESYEKIPFEIAI